MDTVAGIFEIDRERETLIVTPRTDLRELEYAQIDAGMNAVLEHLTRTAVKHVVMDFHRTDYYGTTALGCFVKLWIVTPNLFSAETFFASFDNNQSGLELVDVTGAMQSAINAGESFLGFRLSTTTSDRFFLGPPFTQTGPTLTVTTPIPEPSTILLLCIGTIGLMGWARCSKGRA